MMLPASSACSDGRHLSSVVERCFRKALDENSNSSENKDLHEVADSGATGGATGAPNPSHLSDSIATVDPDLATVIAAWATLPSAIRAGVVALVAASKDTTVVKR